MRLFVKLGMGSAMLLAGVVPAQAQRTPDSYTFMEAVKKGDGNTVNQLVSTQPNLVNTRDGNGDTALIISVRQHDPDWTAFMIRSNADVNAAGEGGDTALIAAARIGFEDAAKWLVDRNAKVDANNKFGETALIVAVQQRQQRMIKLLLNAGANPDKSDFSGHSARDYARRDTRNRQLLSIIEAVKTKK